ncbi:TPR-like protein [Amylostereum chailletii]|nr:TPR-like protein [Amylostereum chailletii]
MSTAFVKNKLKTAREAIARKEYQAAHDDSQQALEYEPDNYTAKVFLGVSLLELGEIEKSEQTYQSAIQSNPKQLLAWQGLTKVYERAEKWDQYAEALLGLAKMFKKADDAVKCAETIQKLVEFRREKGTPMQLVDALHLYLPESPFYPTLSTLPPPDLTQPTATTTFASQSAIYNSLPVFEEIAAILEKDEQDAMKREVDNRRKRLNAAGPEEIKREVGRELLSVSRIPPVYSEILNHPNTPDDLRRTTEAKLLRHKRQYLHALPEQTEQKRKVAEEVQELVNGMVLLKIPDELAWTIFIDGKDAETIEGYDYSTLQDYAALFSSAPLANFIRGYLLYTGNISPSENDDENGEGPRPDEADPYDLMLEAFTNLQDSIIAHRILSETYLWEADYENAISVAEVGLELLRRHARNTNQILSHSQKAFNLILATSLIHFFPPKHHTRALRIIDDVLSQDSNNTQGLMGRGYILHHTNDWTEASSAFSKVMQLLPDDDETAIRAREEHAWCLVQLNDLAGGALELRIVLDHLADLEGKDEDRARCWWRLGNAHWKMGVDWYEDAYGHFISSLKCAASFAPAFTSLGIYYLEAARPADPGRASKCFQKAFELDAREGDAARRLAEGFAEEKEWDLVEVVAKRTIEGEGGSNDVGGSEMTTVGRYLPKNSWAWKAMGVVNLNRRNFPSAITAFQVALRADSDDHLLWVRLGEAYTKAGRHAAAIKALNRARELQPDDWICAYFIGDVQRQTGRFPEAISSFENILQARPDEPGVLMSLAQTHLDLGGAEMSMGFTSRAEDSYVKSLRISLRFVEANPGFRGVAWKIMADAMYRLSRTSSFQDVASVRTVVSSVAPLITLDAGSRLAGILPLPVTVEETTEDTLKGMDVLKVALAAYDYRISLGLSDSSAAASAWFDFGLALHALECMTSAEDVKEKVHKQATTCIMEAVRTEPGEAFYWRALGDMNFVGQPKKAQHAYIKSLEIDDKNVVTWTSLGLLYLFHGDPELANETFYRAQILDPDYHLAWVGQGLVATRNGHFADSRALFEHAVSLTADVPDADLEYARREFGHFSQAAHKSASSDFFPAFFVLGRYIQQRPEDASALHLYGLVAERIGHAELAIQLIGRAITVLEAAYEETEDAVIEYQFTIANTSMARLQLALQDYDTALEFYENALGLVNDAMGGQTRILRAQCQFGSGLAYFKLGRLGEAVESFQAALESSEDDLRLRGHVTVLLAQSLWAMGTEEDRESAKAQLLECITTDPENLTAINTLAGMGILTEDDNLVDAALSEILSLPLHRRLERDPQRNVSYLLTQQCLEQGDVVRARNQAQKVVFAEPSRRNARRDLASLILQEHEPAAARATLAGSEDDVEHLRDVVGICAVAEADDVGNDGRNAALALAQRAVMLEPWNRRNWEILAYVRSQAA